MNWLTKEQLNSMFEQMAAIQEAGEKFAQTVPYVTDLISSGRLQEISDLSIRAQEIGIFEMPQYIPAERIELFGKAVGSFGAVDVVQSVGWIGEAHAELIRHAEVIQKVIQNLPDPTLVYELTLRIQSEQKAIDAFSLIGWPIAPSMPDELKHRVIELCSQKKFAAAQQVIMGYYRRDKYRHLKDMVDRWTVNELFRHRMPIMKEALQAHCDKKYLLSIPALYPQVEGVFNEFEGATQTRPENVGKTNNVYKSVIEGLDSFKLYQWTIAVCLLNVLQEKVYNWQNFKEEIKKPLEKRRVNRHSFSHGIAANYGKESISFKLLLILDAISIIEIPDQT